MEVCSIELALTSLIGWTNVQYHISVSHSIKFIQTSFLLIPVTGGHVGSEGTLDASYMFQRQLWSISAAFPPICLKSLYPI